MPAQPFVVSLTDDSFYSLTALPSKMLYEHAVKDLKLLETTPFLGRVYDPVYNASRPPFQCRVLYCAHYGIYYTVDSQEHTVLVFALEDQRRNPETRFSSMEHYVVSLDEEPPQN